MPFIMPALKDKTIESIPQQEQWPEFDEAFFETIRKNPFFMRKNRESAYRLSKLKGPRIWDKPRS